MLKKQNVKLLLITMSFIALFLSGCSHQNPLLSANSNDVAKVINAYEATANIQNNYKQSILICSAFYINESSNQSDNQTDTKKYCEDYTEKLAAFSQSQGFANATAIDFQDKQVWVNYKNSQNYKPVTESEFVR